MIIDADYVRDNTLIADLVSETDNVINNYIQRAEAVIFSFITDNFDWNYPDDLKLAILFMVEYLYTKSWIVWTEQFKKEKIWDYEYERFDNNSNQQTIPENIMNIIRKYKKHFWKIWFTINKI